MTLRELREQAKLTQDQAAALAHMDQGHISRLERGEIPNPASDTLRTLARTYSRPLGRTVTLDEIYEALQASVAAAA